MRNSRNLKFPKAIRQQWGVAAVEFAIVLPLLVLVFTGMVEYGRLMWHYDALAKATRDAARYLSSEPAITNTERGVAQTMVGNAAIAAGVKGLAVNDTGIPVSCTPNCTSPNTVTVAVSYNFTIGGWVPVFGNAETPITLTPHTTMRYMR